MSLPRLFQSWIAVTGTISCLTLGNLMWINSAYGFTVTFSNGDFDSPTDLDGWSTIGDVDINTGIDGVNPLTSPNQAIITNAHTTTGDRIDDPFSFNQSGTEPVDADTITDNHTGDDLQTFLGLDTNDLSISRANSDNDADVRTSKEGSGMYQDIEINISGDDVTNGTNGFTLSFNWAHLTNDGDGDDPFLDLGNQDFSFISLINDPNPSGNVDSTDSNFVNGNVTVLGDSDQAITAPTGNNDFVYPTTTFYNTNNRYTQSVTGLAAGTYSYRVGFGVVDVDNVDRSSALLLDDFTVEQVPFEFSPGMGLGLMFILISADRIRVTRKTKSLKSETLQ